MTKEILILGIILALIFVGEFITENYTKETIDKISYDLMEMRSQIVNDKKINVDDDKKNIDDINSYIKSRHDKLSYYIEHNELNKVRTELVVLESDIDVEDYQDAVVRIDNSISILNLIKEKSKFNLKNIL